MVKRSITVGHLYPRQMNVYGDMGNVITLKHRLRRRGIAFVYKQIESIEQLECDPVDILIGGGGQDSNQEYVQADLKEHGSILVTQCSEGLVCLMVCGMYQLFGRKFVTDEGETIAGLGILNLETHAGNDRLIGNIVVESPWGTLVGFENHSGRTLLGPGVSPLGNVVKGSGNNDTDKTEGAQVQNVFGTYMHGPVLAKNPEFADELIKRALKMKQQDESLESIDDELEHTAARVAAKRPV